jgi:short-subunit dehydrogenase
MVKAGHDLVINIASTAAFQPTPSMAVYGATKAFVLSFTEALWQETREAGVRVLTVCPGPTETEFFARSGEQFMSEARQTPKQVVDAALSAVSKSTPTVVSGARNSLLACCYRFMPRRVMLKVTQRMMRPAAVH